MKRTCFSLFALVLLITAYFPVNAFAQAEEVEPKLFSLEILNRTTTPVTIVLSDPQTLAMYALTVQSSSQRLFTVREGLYDQTTFACGDTASGRLNVSQQLRLVFTACPSKAPNWGAPTLEKIHLVDAPKGKLWRYRYSLPVPQAPAPPPPTLGTCEFTANGDVTIYRLPDYASNVFATVGSGFSTFVNSQTADGWLGFDPAYAQAGNIGPFHNRWIPPDAPGRVSSGCSALPVVWGPPAGICFATPGETINIYALPDASSAVAGRLHTGDFAAVLGNIASLDWTKVDLAPGNTGAPVVGWVDHTQLYFQGSCGSIPIISP